MVSAVRQGMVRAAMCVVGPRSWAVLHGVGRLMPRAAPAP